MNATLNDDLLDDYFVGDIDNQLNEKLYDRESSLVTKIANNQVELSHIDYHSSLYKISLVDGRMAWLNGFLKLYPCPDGSFISSFENLDVLTALRVKFKNENSFKENIKFKVKMFFLKFKRKHGLKYLSKVADCMDKGNSLPLSLHKAKIDTDKSIHKHIDNIIIRHTKGETLQDIFRDMSFLFDPYHFYILFKNEFNSDSIKSYVKSCGSYKLKKNN